jgi:hypothetical protein
MRRVLTAAVALTVIVAAIPAEPAAAQDALGGALLGGVAGAIIGGAATGRAGGAVAGGDHWSCGGRCDRVLDGAAPGRLLLVSGRLLVAASGRQLRARLPEKLLLTG